MTFDQFEYTRPDMTLLSRKFDVHLQDFQNAPSASVQSRKLTQLNALRKSFSSMYNLCIVRHTSNTADAFYDAENAYFDAQLPAFEALNNRFYEALLRSPFRADLEEKYGKQLFVLAEMALKTFQPTILENLQRENALSSEYTKIKAMAKIPFDGKVYNLSSLSALEVSDDRTVRRRAAEAKWGFFQEQTPHIESLFDQLVSTRHEIAVKLGYRNFVEVGYARMRRSDYTPEMVANYRRQVRELIVPITSALYERQRRRLGLDQLKYYDEEYKFKTGNPKPTGTPEEIVESAARMYRELSPDTDRFFQFMRQSRLMDLVNREDKATGGYCTYIDAYNAPFIFSNFNGTSGDVDVLTHEAGHAFQVWSSSRLSFEEYQWPTFDAAEIHSMSMEFFTWPWMQLFFGEDTQKYYFHHLGSTLFFLPYGVAVDEFQHIVYENPGMTPEERNMAWRQLEKIYLPHRNYDGMTHLEEGRFWQRQNHIFNSPFYYIDYTLAQICALQFWTRYRHQPKQAWKDYIKLCKAGGSRSFLELVQLAGLKSPFEDGCVESVLKEVTQFLDSVEDDKL